VATVVDQSTPTPPGVNRDLLRGCVERMIAGDVSFESADKSVNAVDRVFAKKAEKRLLQGPFRHLVVLPAIAS
jgi:hypothetical protein